MMGRKPNPVIAARFTRGKKHGQTTNRYAQTCNHCGAFFPTGRPETLYAHLANCTGLSEIERAEVVNQMFRVHSGSGTRSSGSQSAQPNNISSVIHNDDFDITGLNVLAGAAENAEDLAIDPQITERDSISETNLPVSQPLTFYDHHYDTSFTTAASSNVWSFPFPSMHETTSPLPEIPTTTASPPNLDSNTLRSVRWTFEPIITPPSGYIAHPASQTPVVFADQNGGQLEYNGDSTNEGAYGPGSVWKIRKSREPYNEPKRARIAAMRQVGACIRCSRLRKPCEPTRPCRACSQTASKTWTGRCTTLNKGSEFTAWFEKHLSRARDNKFNMWINRDPLSRNLAGKLELKLLSNADSVINLDVTKNYSLGGAREDERDDGNPPYTIVHTDEELIQKLLDYSIANQEPIIEGLDEPAIYTTIRTAQGLGMGRHETQETENIWGSGKQNDDKLAHLFDLWLITYVVTTIKLQSCVTVVDLNSHRAIDELSESNRSAVTSQLDAVLDTVISNSKEHLRRFDANILNQNYKYLFNLTIGIFLLLDLVERYCCFLSNRNCPGLDYKAMIDQATMLAYKYSYCVQNIQMIPKPCFDGGSDNDMVGQLGPGKIDHELQRFWMSELCISKTDLEGYLNGWEDDQWIQPTGRLWARLFVPVSRQEDVAKSRVAFSKAGI